MIRLSSNHAASMYHEKTEPDRLIPCNALYIDQLFNTRRTWFYFIFKQVIKALPIPLIKKNLELPKRASPEAWIQRLLSR